MFIGSLPIIISRTIHILISIDTFHEINTIIHIAHEHISMNPLVSLYTFIKFIFGLLKYIRETKIIFSPKLTKRSTKYI